MRILVIAPHPDDEVLGCGGTLLKLAEKGAETFVAIMTKASPHLMSEAAVKNGRDEALAAHKLLNVKKTFFHHFPAARLDTLSHQEINQGMNDLLKEINPDWLLIPFIGDIHLDHQQLFLSSLVAARPNQVNYPKKILAYETLSETNWNAPYLTPHFQPNFYINIEAQLDKKLKACQLFTSQIKNFPHERSLVTLEALAKLRGATIFCRAAEAFILIREVME